MDSLATLSGLGYSRPLVAEALKQVSLLLPLWHCQCMKSSSGIAQCFITHQKGAARRSCQACQSLPSPCVCILCAHLSLQALCQDASSIASRTLDAAPLVAHAAELSPCRLTMTCKGRWIC